MLEATTYLFKYLLLNVYMLGYFAIVYVPTRVPTEVRREYQITMELEL